MGSGERGLAHIGGVLSAGAGDSWTVEGKALLAEHQRLMREDPEYARFMRGETVPNGIPYGDFPPLAEAYNAVAEMRRKAGTLTEDQIREFAASAAERARRDRLDRRRRLEIPRRLWPYLDEIQETEAVWAVLQFLATPKLQFLVLRGDKGVGKTIAGAYAVERKGGRMLDVQELVQAGQFDKALWEQLREAPLLVLDEMGAESAEPGKSWYGAALFALLNKRYDWNRKTILTGNLSREDFETRYLVGQGERLRDRLKECGWDYPLKGESRRELAPLPTRSTHEAREPGEDG